MTIIPADPLVITAEWIADNIDLDEYRGHKKISVVVKKIDLNEILDNFCQDGLFFDNMDDFLEHLGKSIKLVAGFTIKGPLSLTNNQEDYYNYYNLVVRNTESILETNEEVIRRILPEIRRQAAMNQRKVAEYNLYLRLKERFEGVSK